MFILIFINPISFTKHQAPTSVVNQLLKLQRIHDAARTLPQGLREDLLLHQEEDFHHQFHHQRIHHIYNCLAEHQHYQVMTVTPTFPAFGEITTAS